MSIVDRITVVDYRLSQRIAALIPIHSHFRKVIQIFSISGTSFFWFFGLTLAFLVNNQHRAQIFTLWVTLLILVPPVFLLKHTVKRPRPDFKDTRMGTTALDQWSFPSGHASRVVFLVVLLADYFPQYRLLPIIWGIAIVVSRLLLGVHYISDIISGLVVSTIVVGFLFWIKLLPIFPWVPPAPF